MAKVAGVRFKRACKVYYFDANGLTRIACRIN
jgi:hypothetical protein